MVEGRTKAALTLRAFGLICLPTAVLGALSEHRQGGPVLSYSGVLLPALVATALIPFASVLLWVSWLDWKRRRAAAGRLV